MQDPHDQITAAHKLIADPARWSRGALARDKHGREVSPTSKRAAAWDVRGALQAVCGTRCGADDKGSAVARCNYLCCTADLCAHRAFKSTLERATDDRGHAAAVEVLRRAWRQVQVDPPKQDAFGGGNY